MFLLGLFLTFFWVKGAPGPRDYVVKAGDKLELSWYLQTGDRTEGCFTVRGGSREARFAIVDQSGKVIYSADVKNRHDHGFTASDSGVYSFTFQTYDDIPEGNIVDSYYFNSSSRTASEKVYRGSIAHIMPFAKSDSQLTIYHQYYAAAKYVSSEPIHGSWGNEEIGNACPTLNTSLTIGQDGPHCVIVYANDTVGNMGSSDAVHFSVATTPPDVAVTNVTRFKNVVGQGYSMGINATVENQGDNNTAFNVTVYANETMPVEIVSLELAGGASVTVEFTWNTTGFAYGNYSISACATPVENEIQTANNLLVDGWVFVTIPGDVNGDKRVNILDYILIANHFGHVDGDGHTPCSKELFDCVNCDISSDARTNVLDCIILSNSFGQSWT